jgi:hypothetical protein
MKLQSNYFQPKQNVAKAKKKPKGVPTAILTHQIPPSEPKSWTE